jgi:conjugal transfer pilus assembly protein TraF
MVKHTGLDRRSAQSLFPGAGILPSTLHTVHGRDVLETRAGRNGGRGQHTITLLVNLIAIVLANTAFADSYYSQHAVGWHWYDDPKEEVTIKKESEKPQLSTKSDPNAVVATARKKITTALNKAIVDPTIENLEAYIAMQEQLNNRAEKIADLWQQVLLKDPQLNYSLTHPTNNVALQVYHEEESKEKEKAMSIFASQTGLFFFYRSTCAYCQRFAPILKSFAAHNGITVIPITLDGLSLPEFPHSKMDSGQAIQFHVTVTPSVFAVNPTTQKAFPVAYGLTSETELRDNIYHIMTKYEGDK